MKPGHSKAREVLAARCQHAAARWVAAEVRYFEAVLTHTADSRAASARDLATARRYLAQGPRTDDEVPPAHPLADPGRQIIPSRWIA